MEINNIIERKSLRKYYNDENDSFYICWASPEYRCLGGVLKLSEDYFAEHIIIITYEHKSEKREENIIKMKDLFKDKGKVEQIFVNEDAPLPIFSILCKRIKNHIEKKNKPIITIDISTAIKWHLLVFLKYLNSIKLLKFVRFIYTEPEDYYTNILKPMSFGLKEIFPIPTFSGNFDFDNENLLVVILGFEGNRAYSLYENMDTAETILLIADPPYYEKWKGRAEKMNQKIINLVGKDKIKKIDSRDPFKVAQQLKIILSDEKYKNYNHFISPLGTKLQLLGLFLYLETKPKMTNLIYCVPLRHNELFYSYGLGKTWEIRL